jgi:tetratricopeptide (TPR) repeat protein
MCNGNNAEEYFQSGLHHFDLHEHEKAIECFQQVIKIDPNHAKAVYHLGLSYAKSNYKYSALEQCKILEKLHPELANRLRDFVNQYCC